MLGLAARALTRRATALRAQSSRSMTEPVRAASGWAASDVRRPMHAVVHVTSVDQHVDYYTKHFGMQLLEKSQGAAFLGYGPLASKFALKVVEQQAGAPDSAPLDLGTGFGHFGIVLPDVYGAVHKIKSEGGKVTRDAGPVKGGKTVIAFVKDPSGYLWELIQRGDTPEPLCQVMLRVTDLPKSIKWYSDVLGMQLTRERDNPEYKYTLGFMGYGPEDSSLVMELTYNYDSTSYTKGNAYSHVALSTKDIHKTAEEIKAAGGKLLSEPALMPGTNTLACTTEDPDGWPVMFIQE